MFTIMLPPEDAATPGFTTMFTTPVVSEVLLNHAHVCGGSEEQPHVPFAFTWPTIVGTKRKYQRHPR